ncbi:hypothetical protein Cni_G06221 [Canna indica]|uniref:Uncharacterized protein n=1 Tax=Canna indica TaxID=4628 RepID=A0AAQ3JY41_9LILI|nr:hypothetical protein Cni_G06221 [Canna indica]
MSITKTMPALGVQNNVAAFWPDDSFRYIVVGNEVISESLAQFILPAMRNVATALAAAGLKGQIKFRIRLRLSGATTLLDGGDLINFKEAEIVAVDRDTGLPNSCTKFRSIVGVSKKKTAKVMKLDGTVTRLDLPAAASAVLRCHPGYSLLDAEEVKRAGAGAHPLTPGQLLEPGKLYFLVELPRSSRLPRREMRRARSAEMHGSAMDRLESLRLTRRRSTSDASVGATHDGGGDTTVEEEGAMQIRIRLPKARVKKLVEESEDEAEVTERLVALCFADRVEPEPTVMTSPSPARKEVRTA